MCVHVYSEGKSMWHNCQVANFKFIWQLGLWIWQDTYSKPLTSKSIKKSFSETVSTSQFWKNNKEKLTLHIESWSSNGAI